MVEDETVHVGISDGLAHPGHLNVVRKTAGAVLSGGRACSGRVRQRVIDTLSERFPVLLSWENH